jgi:hypothetical protein
MYNRRIFFLIVLSFCFLLGMATRAEVEDVKKEAESTPTVESETTEKYVPRVIINAKWGDGPGEFGFDPDPDVPSAGTGPCGLIVDNGELYILDAVNQRINVYLNNGSFQKSIGLEGGDLEQLFFNPGFVAFKKDNENNFYLLGYDSPSGGSKILKFDSNGNFIKELCKSLVDEELLQEPLYLPPPLLWKKERRDSLGTLLENYSLKGEVAPSNLKAEYDSLGRILEDFRSLRERKEPLRISFDPALKIKGDSIIVNVNGEERLVYFDKKSGKELKERKTNTIRISKYITFEDYPEVIKSGIGLSEDLREFVLDSRYNVSTMSATDFDQEGNFYELLWKPYGENLKMGVKVIKWGRV